MQGTYINILLLSFMLNVSGIAMAQTGPVEEASKIVRIVRAETPPVLDGRLSDPVWQHAEVMTDFHQIRPHDGAEPSERTEVYLLYDDDALYIGARMYDSEPERIAAPTARHGRGLGRDDRLVVILDPFNTRRAGAYRFETNLNGVRHDAIYTSASSFESNWSTIWETATSVFENGWIAELKIPFKSLSFDPRIDSWGFNFGRGIRRRGEEVAWVSRNRSYNASILGLATGLEGMKQGLGLDIVPSVSLNRRKTYSPSTNDFNFEPSLDVYYRITPSLNASLTLNTDFSATEVDDRQVNLSRFNLFFPEKRKFFLNDADLFEFGRIGRTGNGASNRSNNNNGRPFFSRRLGLSRAGTPVDLNFGSKLGGRVGRWNIGMLAIQQDSFESVRKSNIFVGRVTANVLDESSVGVIFTTGDTNSNQNNRVAGLDFRYLNTHFPGGRVLEADAWFQKSDMEDLDGEDTAFGLGIRMPNNTGLRGGLYYKQVEENFSPALGFVNRANIRDSSVDVGYTNFFSGDLFRSVYAGIDAQRISYLDGGLQSQVILGRLAEVSTTTGESLNVHISATKEVLGSAFTIYRDINRQIVVPPGTYSFNEAEIAVSTGGQRPLSGGLSYRRGNFYAGNRDKIGADLSWRQSRFFAMSLSYERNDIRLPQGDFVTHLSSLTTEVNFSSTLYWVNLVQYDNVSEVIGMNARLVWIPKAGQEALLVLNHSMQDRDKDNSFENELNDISLKLSYTFRF